MLVQVLAVAMSEPEVGSDLGQLSCRAAALPDGGWIVNGRKMWISSGALAELTVVACVTDPSKGAKGISMLVIESDMPGFSCAKRFGKLGKHASDTCLITLEDVKVPRENLVGEERKGWQPDFFSGSPSSGIVHLLPVANWLFVGVRSWSEVNIHGGA